MFEFHKDKSTYFNWQYLIARDYVIPFIEENSPLQENSQILEIGCGEAGVLKAFLEAGHTCTGIELMESRTLLARSFFQDHPRAQAIRFVNENIYNIDPVKDESHQYDLVILKDVIEHIPDQERFMKHLRKFLKPNGKVFFAFPPWQMPFGGHQQICNNKKLAKLPYFHLLPKGIYRWILQKANEPAPKIQELIALKATGITIERFESITRSSAFNIVDKIHYLINPIYQFKFRLTPKKQLRVLQSIPYFRNYWTTCVYYLVKL